MEKPQPDKLERTVSEVRKVLESCKAKRATGKVFFVLELYQGGIKDAKVTVERPLV